MPSYPVLQDKKGNGFEMRPWSCPTCGPGPVRRLGLRGGAYQRAGEGVATTIVACDRCGLLFPDPFPVPLDAQRLYGDPTEYFAEHDLDSKIAAYRGLARKLKERTGGERPRLLDIGSGRGDFLHAASMEGINEAVGLEFSDAMIAFARDRFSLELRKQTAEALAEQEPGRFDVVVLNAVLEHVHDPLSMMRAVATLCRPGAVLYLDVPREPHLLAVLGNGLNRLRGNPAVLNLQPTWAPFHVYGFNPQALETLLVKTGFAIEEIDVHANPRVPAGPGARGRLIAFGATQVNRIANALRFSSNMFVWARRS